MIVSKAVNYLRGSATLRVEERYKSGFLRMLLSENIPASICELTENGEKHGVEAVISPKFIKKVTSVLDKYSIKVYIINIKGFCALLPSLRNRIGIIVGAVLFFTLLLLSTLFIWRVEIVGAESVSEEYLREVLSESGVDAGAIISRIDAFSVSNSLLLSCPELSWASLRLKGTTATLTVRETVPHQEVKENETPLLIASESGVIRSILVYEGTAAVKVGSVVRAGDALINGLISGSGLQYTDEPVLRLGKARGSVKAMVEREISATVPYRETEHVIKENGQVYREKAIRIFGLKLHFGKKAPNEVEYALNESEYSPTVFGIALPVTVYEKVWRELIPQEKLRTPEEAETLARERADGALKESLGASEASFTEYTVFTDSESGSVTVKVLYRFVTEIATPARIGTSD